MIARSAAVLFVRRFSSTFGRISGLFVLAVAAILGSGAVAQDAKSIVDTWQGTLHAPQRDLRIVLKIAADDKGALKGTFYSIDQGASVAGSSTTFQDGTLTFAVAMAELKYEGKMAADGKSISGTYKQGDGPGIPMVLVRATPETAWVIPEAPKPLPPMPVDAKPVFDVATIKPSNPDQQGKGFTFRNGNFVTINTTLLDIVKFSYGLQDKQVVGLPDWATTEKWDFNGKADIPGMPNPEQTRHMMQQMLIERFGLKFHEDKKEMPAYVLSVAKTGPKMELAPKDAGPLPGLFFAGRLGTLRVTNATMDDFCQLMQSAVLDRPVVNQTGLTAKYNFLLKWTPDESQFAGMGMKVPPPSDAADAPPPLYTAVTEQIGLKLEAGKAQVKVFVVDHAEKPSAN
jgi:uncharacterized protein (TIGR03435 family)